MDSFVLWTKSSRKQKQGKTLQREKKKNRTHNNTFILLELRMKLGKYVDWMKSKIVPFYNYLPWVSIA